MKYNNDLLEFLMSSDYSENIHPDKLKEYLIAFKYFYRLQSGQIENSNYKLSNLENKISNLNSKLEISISNEKEHKNNLNVILNRKLTLKERILAKIIIEK